MIRAVLDDRESARERFKDRLQKGLAALAELLERPDFGVWPPSIGAELELFLIDEKGRPLRLNEEVRAEVADPRVQLELGRFNLEVNVAPALLAGRPFTQLGERLREASAKIATAARRHGARLAIIGILPTIRWPDLDAASLTDKPRYHALRRGVLRLRPPDYHISIEGDEALTLHCKDITLEAAATSFHTHLRVAPGDFVRTYNAAQLAVGPTLAIAGNSPCLLEHMLWEETRVPLLRQWAAYQAASSPDQLTTRVSFGQGWLRGGALELFQESVALHPPLIPELGPEEDPMGRVRAGSLPSLDELRLHQSTVWRWNRAVYDPTQGGHLRIEMRVLPAGPTFADMLANNAFLVGLTLALAEEAERLVAVVPFDVARRNFLDAARHGLDAELLWPGKRSSSPSPVKAAELLPELLPLARQGLVAAGVEADEADSLLEVLAARAASRLTGACWQRRVLAELEKKLARPEALAVMLERYLELAAKGEPVHRWPTET